MALRGTDLALGLAAVGTVAAVGYVLRSRDRRSRPRTARARVGARIVDPEEVPATATVVDGSSRRLEAIPGVVRAIERAERRGEDRWGQVTLRHEDAWAVVDAVRESLPYEAGGAGPNGVYLRRGGRVIVLDAVGWAVLEEPPT